MPWKKAAGKEWFVWDLPAPEVSRADWRSSNRFMRWYWRNVADWFRVPTVCRRKACRRAGRCSTADVACFREEEEIFRLVIFPSWRKAHAAHAAGAAYDPDAADVARDRRQWMQRDAAKKEGKGASGDAASVTSPRRRPGSRTKAAACSSSPEGRGL